MTKIMPERLQKNVMQVMHVLQDYYLFILLHESFSDTVRLKTR